MSSCDFESRLNDGIAIVNASSPGVRDIPVIANVGPNKFLAHPDTVMLEVQPIIRNIGRIYRFGKNIVLDKDTELVTLIENGIPCENASSVMANYLLVQGGENAVPQTPSTSFLQHVFNCDLILVDLRVISRYVKMPTYDDEFNLLQPGYDPVSGVMVHGEPVVPIPFVPPCDLSVPLRERAPAILQEMLIDFPFATVIDFVNTLGLILLALLASLFSAVGRAIALLSGNQPGVGKTILANVLGVILDGAIPTVTEFSSSNDELSKRILATIRSRPQSVILIDNARAATGGVIDSTSLEATAVAEMISLRILGSSINHEEPNNFLWVLSMNAMKTTPDLAQRGILIRLEHEGPASLRRYRHTDLVAFVKEHRTEIIETCYGMVEHWKAQGRPEGQATHRFGYMARTIGGILDSCGLPGFLSNHQEAVQSINSTADDLVALFDAVLGHTEVQTSLTSFFVPDRPVAVSDLIPQVVQAGIATEELAAAKGEKAKATRIGQVFTRLLNLPFPVEVGDRTGTATFLKVTHSRNRSGYYFRVDLVPFSESVPETAGELS